MSYKAQGSKLKAGPSAVGGKRAQSLKRIIDTGCWISKLIVLYWFVEFIGALGMVRLLVLGVSPAAGCQSRQFNRQETMLVLGSFARAAPLAASVQSDRKRNCAILA